jgi:hypothetical protein
LLLSGGVWSRKLRRRSTSGEESKDCDCPIFSYLLSARARASYTTLPQKRSTDVFSILSTADRHETPFWQRGIMANKGNHGGKQQEDESVEAERIISNKIIIKRAQRSS